MNTRTAFIPSGSPFWVLVTDGRQARFYQLIETERTISMSGASKRRRYEEIREQDLTPVEESLLATETRGDYDLGHGRRGALASDFSSTRHTFEPREDIGEKIERRFAQSVAAKLSHAYAEKRFDRLAIVAPPRMLGELRGHLAPEVAKCIAVELPKELAHCAEKEVLAHVKRALASLPPQAA